MSRFFRAAVSLFRDNVPVLVFIALVANGLLIFFIERDRRPRVVYHVQRIVTETNSTTAVTSSGAVASSDTVRTFTETVSSSDPVLPDVSVPYHYYEVAGRPFAFMYGFPHGPGSATSRGIIRRIFPDRIQLDTGQWLVNSQSFTSYHSTTNRALL